MRRLALLAIGLAALAGAAEAQAQAFRVVVVPGLELADLEALAGRAAVGLLVPDAGPETSEERARAALVRGKVRNSLRGGLPSGPPLISVETASALPEVGPAIVLALPRGGEQANDRRYPIAVLGAGYEGLLTSDSTRIPGLVSIADVAPTALGRAGALESRAEQDAVAELVDLDGRIDDNGTSRMPAFLLAGALIAALALLRPRAAVLAFATALAANLILGAAAISGLWIVLIVVALATAVAAPLLAVLVRSPAAVGLALAAVIAAYLAALALDGPSVALSPLGPTQNSRFYGISNLLETMLLVPALAGAALLGERPRIGFAAVALLAFATVAGSRFGADGGGAIVLAAAYAVLAVGLAGARRRTLVAALAAAAALVVALIGIDALSGASSHVTRALEDGPAGLASDLADRLALSYERAVSRWYVALAVAGGILALALLVARTLRTGLARRPRALLVAFVTAIGVSLVVNDSPFDVVVAGVVGYLALDAYARASPTDGHRELA